MIWFLIVPIVWSVLSLLVGVFIGQCIRIAYHDAPDDVSAEAEVSAEAAAASAEAGPSPFEDQGREAAEDTPAQVGAPAEACVGSDGRRLAVRGRAFAGTP
jgi:hypothetical protein